MKDDCGKESHEDVPPCEILSNLYQEHAKNCKTCKLYAKKVADEFAKWGEIIERQ